MSHILRSAVTRPGSCDNPLDLSFNKYMRQTCDPILNQEDLRQDIDSTSRFEPKFVPFRDSGFSSSSSENGADGSISESSSESSGLSDYNVYVKQEVTSPRAKKAHPFSIDALLGDTDDNVTSPNASAAAVVSSCHSSATYQSSISSYQRYLLGLYQNTQRQANQHISNAAQNASGHVSYWCHVCNALCIDSEDAKKHQYYHHHQRAPCNLRKSLLMVHGYVSKHVKLDEERMQCGMCEKVVASCFFTKHQRLHDGHICDVCNKEFSTNSRLQDHMNVHSGVEPFKCTICDRRFAKRSSLTQHHRYHRDHKSFKCTYCYKSFNSKYARAVHERLHTGDNPFKCTVPGCTRAFPQKIQLKLHVSSHMV